jgi:leukotriene-A4 hydrolase
MFFSVVFLDRFHFHYKPLPSNLITHLGILYGFATSNNSEIRFRFYALALADPKSDAANSFAIQAARWVVGNDGSGVIQGRMKYCRPVFQDINKVNSDLAKKTFNKWGKFFHPIAQKMIRQVCYAYFFPTPIRGVGLWWSVCYRISGWLNEEWYIH